MNKLKLALLGLVLSASAAFGQAAPNWTQGYVPSPAEWNAVFAGKQDYLGSAPLLVNGGTMTGELITASSATNSAGLNVPPGVAPTSPVNGDLWSTPAGFFVQVNGATIGPLTEGTSGSFAATTPIGVAFSGGTVTYSCATCGVTGSPLSQFASTTSAQLAGVISDESGTGPLLFGNSPSITTPTINFATGGNSFINASSTNTGFVDQFQIQNSGTPSNASTQTVFLLGLGALANGFFDISTIGGSSPSASMTTGVGLTGGLTISAGAGPLNITNPILSTPTLGVAKATSLALGGAAIGSNALAATGTFAFSAGGSFGGALTGITTASMSGQLTSTLATGTAPFSVASTTNVANLNASSLNGATFAAPGAIGGTTPGSGAFTTLGATNGGSLAGTFSGTPAFSGANFLTLSNLVQSTAGAQFLGVTGASAANYAPFTLASLTPLASPSATLDLLPCVDHTSGTIKSCTPSSISSAVGSGVTSFNALTGAVTTAVVVQTFTTVKSTTVSITAASPAVITWSNTLSAGQWVEFTSGTLPTGLSLNTPYCVIATGLSTSSFEVATACGGSAINTSGSVGSGITGTMAYVPTPGVLHAIGECVGGGAGSGGATGVVNQYYAGGGGGSGGYSRKYLTAASVGASQSVTVGAGGIAGNGTTTNGGNGGTTNIGSLCSANGGIGGMYGASTQLGFGGAGGTAGTGDIAAAGMPGTSGMYSTNNTIKSPGGNGGSSIFGGGANGSTANGVCGSGVAALAYGSGAGGGACDSTAATVNGAAGSPGFVVITEYVNL